jgi:hypothetical protein
MNESIMSDIMDQLTRAPHGEPHTITMEVKQQPFPSYSLHGNAIMTVLATVTDMIREGYVETYSLNLGQIAYRLTNKGYEKADSIGYLGRFANAADWFTYRAEFEKADATLPDNLLDMMATVRCDMAHHITGGVLSSEVVALTNIAIQHGKERDTVSEDDELQREQEREAEERAIAKAEDDAMRREYESEQAQERAVLAHFEGADRPETATEAAERIREEEKAWGIAVHTPVDADVLENPARVWYGEGSDLARFIYQPVKRISEAGSVLQALYQLALQRYDVGYNAGGLEIQEGPGEDDWSEWYAPNGRGINTYGSDEDVDSQE